MQLNEHLFLTNTFGSSSGCSEGPSKSCFSGGLGEIDGASGNSSPHTKMQFKIITASALFGASLPTWCRGACWGQGKSVSRLSSLGEGGLEPQPLELPTPSKATGRDTSGSVDPPQPLPELAPHPEQSKGVRKGPKENRGTKAAEQPLKHTEPHPLGLCPPDVSGCLLHFKKLCSPGQRLRASWLSTHHCQAQRQALNYVKDQLSHLPASLRVTRKINPEERSKKASNGRRLVSSLK